MPRLYTLTKKVPIGRKTGGNSKPITAWGNLRMSLTSIIEGIKVNSRFKGFIEGQNSVKTLSYFTLFCGGSLYVRASKNAFKS